MAQQLQLALTKHKQPRLAALLEAAKPCKLGAVKSYLTAGGTPNAVVQFEPYHYAVPGYTYTLYPSRVSLLCAAVANHEVESVKLLLTAGARPDVSLNYPNGKSYTALMQSAAQKCCDRDDIAKLLLEHGADPCKASADGTTALHLAASAGQVSKCKPLLTASSSKALTLQTA
jgi:Ankyrin repeats (3 copies)